MSLATWFRRAFLDVETEVRAVEQSIVHLVEKELKMIPQPIQDLINQIAAALSSHSSQGAADAATISGLNGQVADLTSQGQAKDAQIGSLTQQVSDLNGEVNDIQAALAAALAAAPAPATAPAPAPAVDGSASGDVLP